MIFAIWYPLNYERTVISNNYASALQTAYDNYAADHRIFTYISEKQQAETDFQNAWKQTSVIKALRQTFLTWNGLMIVIFPPLFLYIAIWGVCFLVRWVARGSMMKTNN